MAESHAHSADHILVIPAGSGYKWPQEMHETLILAIYFTFLNMFPWELRRKNLLLGVGRHLRGVLKEYHSLVEDLLSNVFQQTRRMVDLPFINMRKLLSLGPISCVYSE